MILLLSACAHRAPATVLPPFQGSDGFVIRAGDRSLGGAAVVDVGDAEWTLLGLTPAGTALFSIRGGEALSTEVTAPDPAMAKVLGVLPFERDLWLLYRWRCDDRCRTDRGVLTVDEGILRWRGRGGRATVTRADGRTVLTDPRRGYTVTVAGGGVR